MATVDTHTAVKNLIASGFTEKQSEAIVDIHKYTNGFATKEQVDSLEKEQSGIKTDIAAIKTNIAVIKTDIVNIKENMATKADLAKVKTDVILSMIGLIFSSTAITVGLITYFLGK